MRTTTRLAFNAYIAHLAALNGVPSARETFTVEPTVEQKLEDRVQESAAFLQEINIVPVQDQVAQVLMMGTDGPIAGRTDTTGGARRQPRNIIGITPREYTCRKTDFDHGILYAKLDQWSKFPDFQVRIRNHVTRQIARDRLMIGWNGATAAATTDVAVHTKLQDVNKGWLQSLREEVPERVLSGLKVGDMAGADFKNMDALVTAAAELLGDLYVDDPAIIAMTGRALLTDKYIGILNSSDVEKPTEQNALKTLLTNKNLGGYQAKAPPFFPGKSVLLSAPSNLSIYWQEGSHRRMIKDEPEYNRVVDYGSDNEAYVIEDLEGSVLIENILVPNAAGNGWE